jgi:hypothetical protein
MAGARVTYGKPAVAWTLTPGSTADLIQFTRSLPANPNAFWPRADEQSPLSPKQTSWRAGERFAPAVMTYFGVRGGRITNVKLGRVVFAKYDPFFGRIL